MYKFVADFLADSTPGRPLSEVDVVAGDGFFDQYMIVKFGFVNATFFKSKLQTTEGSLGEDDSGQF